MITVLAKNKPHLKPALDQIERGDGSVSEATGQDTSEAAESVVLVAAEFARVLTSSGCGTGAPGPHGAGENALHLLGVHVGQVRVIGGSAKSMQAITKSKWEMPSYSLYLRNINIVKIMFSTKNTFETEQ